MNRLAPVRQAFPEERDLRALVDFANIDDPEAIPKFRRQHSGFEPFELAGTSAMDFPSAVLAYCELLRQLWRGSDSWELQTLLGLNPATCGEWVDTGEAARLWNKGLREIQAAGLRFPKKPPVLRASWRLGGFTYNSTSDFQNSVFALWQERWRAKICPMCESYFVADEKATKFCSAFCAREGKNERNRRWWRDNGPEWKQKFLQAKNRARKARRRKGK